MRNPNQTKQNKMEVEAHVMCENIQSEMKRQIELLKMLQKSVATLQLENNRLEMTLQIERNKSAALVKRNAKKIDKKDAEIDRLETKLRHTIKKKRKTHDMLCHNCHSDREIKGYLLDDDDANFYDSDDYSHDGYRSPDYDNPYCL